MIKTPVYERILTKMISNKNIAIVGNSTSLFDTSYGDEIDSHDIVIRMNKAAIFYPDDCSVSHGTKMDVWAFWTVGAFIRVIEEETTPAKMKHTFYEDYSIRKLQACMNGHKKYTDKYIDETLSLGLFTHLRRQLNNLSDINDTIQPSTGITMIQWLAYNKVKKISIYGFDWKKTPSFSEPELYEKDIVDRYDFRCKHDFIAEERYFNEYIIKNNPNVILRA